MYPPSIKVDKILFMLRSLINFDKTSLSRGFPSTVYSLFLLNVLIKNNLELSFIQSVFQLSRYLESSLSSIELTYCKSFKDIPLYGIKFSSFPDI